MKNWSKWSKISGVIMSVGFLTILCGGLTDVYDWGNPSPLLITGSVVFVIGGILHQVKG